MTSGGSKASDISDGHSAETSLTLDADAEQAVRTLLRDLPAIPMPESVHVRLQAVLATEAEKRAREGAVADLGPRRARRRSAGRSPLRAFALGTATAAAVTAIAVVLVGQQPHAAPLSPSRAAVVALHTSGTAYNRADLANQVGARWRSTRAAGQISSFPPPSDPNSPDDGVVLASAPDVPLATDLVASSFTRSQREAAECFSRVAPNANPVMIDIATYHRDSDPAGAPAAVLAFGQPDDATLDVYVVDRMCDIDGADVLAHVTAAPGSQ